jgi:hypothetical protein
LAQNNESGRRLDPDPEEFNFDVFATENIKVLD